MDAATIRPHDMDSLTRLAAHCGFDRKHVYRNHPVVELAKRNISS